MNISLSFVEYDAANNLRNLSPVVFALLSTATLGQDTHGRKWIVRGSPEAFAVLRAELSSAKERFLRSSIASSVVNIVDYIDVALAASAGAPAASAGS